MNARVLVTGANGFVGFALCEALIRMGLLVRAAVRRNAGDLNGIDVVVVGEVNQNTNWVEALNEVDVVIHLAARVHVKSERTDHSLAEFMAVNLDGTVNLARAAIAAGVKRLVYLSTVKVNGELTKGSPFTERDIPNPSEFYGISKMKTEQALLALAAESGLEVVILRPPLVYGPKVKANFASLIKMVDTGMPLPFASIHNKRSMIYLGNLVSAIITCAFHSKAAGETYLVSDVQDVSTTDLVKMIADSLQRYCLLFYFPFRTIRALLCFVGKSASIDRLTQSLVIDSSKIKTQLGWEPIYTMQQGLNITTAWYLKCKNSKFTEVEK